MVGFFFKKEGWFLIIKVFFFLGLFLKNIFNDKCEFNRVKNDVNIKDWLIVVLE